MVPDPDIKSKVFQCVVSIISECCSIEPSKIDVNTSLEDDLGITGDDFDELIILMNEKILLGFDMSKIEFYIGPEYMTFKSKKIKDLSVNDIVEMLILRI